MLYRKPSVGQQTSAYCGRCKLERTHTIAAMESDGTIKKVTCSMCGSYHNYSRNSKNSNHNHNGDNKKDGASKRTRSTRAMEDLSQSGKPARPYAMTACFTEGDIINHPKFGLGCVETIKAPDKIEVRFQEGKKILVHNTSGTP